MSALEIICTDRRSRAALLKFLKLLQHPLRFGFITRPRQQNADVIERGFVIGFGRNCPTKCGNGFCVFFLLGKCLSDIDI